MDETEREAGRQLMRRCDQLARFSETPEHLTRRFLTEPYRAALDQVAAWMRGAGMEPHSDAAGNLIGRYEGQQPDKPVLLLGSHIDTVVGAGRYDGMLGVLAAIACVERMQATGYRPQHPVEVIVFGDEEGARFGVAMIGSRAFTGTLPTEWLDKTDASGMSLACALRAYGLAPDRLGAARRDPATLLAYLELHIEQGTRLEQAGLPVAAVTRISAVKRARLRLTGALGHAGTVAMSERRDALTGMAEVVLAVEALARRGACIATVGNVTAKPGAANVIAGHAEALLDIRAPENAALEAALAELTTTGQAIATRRGLSFTVETFYHAPSAAFAPGLVRLAQQALGPRGAAAPVLISAAGHDAAMLAPLVPSVMLFARCRGGISHAPEEEITAEDAAAAITAFSTLVDLVDRAGPAATV